MLSMISEGVVIIIYNSVDVLDIEKKKEIIEKNKV
jgi:hypothetical protein